jgi:hypothetical protein
MTRSSAWPTVVRVPSPDVDTLDPPKRTERRRVTDGDRRAEPDFSWPSPSMANGIGLWSNGAIYHPLANRGTFSDASSVN